MKMAWKLENIRKDPNSKELYADLFISQIKEEPKTACLFTVGDARTVEIILEKHKNTQFVVFDYPALIKFLDFAKPANLFNAIPIKYDWESEAEFLKFIEVEMQKILKEIEEANMSFDLIIANPPYGKSSSLAQQIIDTVKAYAKQSIWLVPVNTCKYDEVLKSCESVNILSRADSSLFEGATIGRLSLLKISPKTNNSSLVYEDLILSTLDKKLIELRKATKAYNEKIGIKSIYTIDGNYLLKKYDKTLKEASKQTLPKTFESIANRNVKDLRDEGYCFYNTVRSTVDGVHFTDGYDRRYNFEGIWDNKVDTTHSGDLLCFESKEARNNFRDWWYSCTKKYANKVECNRRGLTNMYLTLLGNCVSLSAGIGYYIDYFPQVEWSHPWTDQEILKELGLPEDFLGE